MSGFGGVFSAAMISIVFVLAISSFTSYSYSYFEAFQTLGHIAPQCAASLDSAYLLKESNAVVIRMTMLSSSPSVSFKDLKKCDLFLIYVSGGSKITERLEFDKGWRIIRCGVGDAPEILNPLRESSGMWDPGETVEISISPSFYLDEDSSCYFVFVFQDGSVVRTSFEV